MLEGLVFRVTLIWYSLAYPCVWVSFSGYCITRWYFNRLNEITTLSSFEYSSNQNIISQNRTVPGIRQNQTKFYTMEQFEHSSKPNRVYTIIKPFRYYLVFVNIEHNFAQKC